MSATAAEDEELLTPGQTSGRLKLGKTKTNELIRTGKIRSVKIGRSRRIPASALREYIERLQREAV
jgi:excisionase family DNA binding protein